MTVEVLLDRLFAGNNFPPAYGGDLLKELRNDVLAARQAAFIALMLRVGAHGGGTAREAEDGLERFLAGGREERMAIVADPAFSIWLQKAARLEVAEQGVLGRTVADFRFVLQRCVERLGRDDLGLLRPVELLRHDVDPLVAEVAPPTYTFPALERVRELEEKTPYTLEIFNRVARATLSRIGAVWPEVQELFPYYVRAIVHVPDADFRSASASRYAGVIFLTAHFGNWELAGRLLLRRFRRPTHVLVAAEPDPGVEAFLRGGGPLRFVTRDHPVAGVTLLAALRRNEVVAMQGDRGLGTRGDLALPFFGAPAAFPLGPFVLARAAGAPLLPAFCALRDDRRYAVTLGAPIRVAPEGEAAALVAWVRVLEDRVRRQPEQWFNFFDVWGGAPAR